MPLLKAEPGGTVRSLDELFALAHAMESEAARRYAEFAELMRAQDREDLAAVFQAIAAEEQGHVESVTAWSESSVGHDPDPGAIPFRAPGTFEQEDESALAGSTLMTPYRALSIAVRNEERAFAFWSYVAAQAEREDVRRAAERMAREELGHVAAFRRERRKAYHAQRSMPVTPHSASEMEKLLAGRLDALAHERPADAPIFSALAEETRTLARLSVGLPLDVVVPSPASEEQLAEALADAYLQAAELPQDEEDALEALQGMAERAIIRLSRLRDLTR